MTYQSITMRPAEIEAFLADSRHAVIATSRANCSPQLSPIWYLYRDGKLYAGIDTGSAKYRNLMRDPRVSVCVDGAYPDARYVVIYGMAKFIREASARRDDIVRAIYLRYHETSEEAERSLRENSGSGSVVLVVTPQKIFGQDYN